MSVKAIPFIVIHLIVCINFSGCTASPSNPVVPDTISNQEPFNDRIQADLNNSVSDTNRLLWGMWDFTFEPASEELAVEPVREIAGHFNVTGYIFPQQCEDCFDVDIFDFQPNNGFVKLMVTLKNPTNFTAYDVRGILITNDENIGMLNPDAYTGLWDDGGGITINPFMAFSLDWPNRKFPPNISKSRVFEIEFPEVDDLLNGKIAIDASWPSNCKEPYEINNFCQETIFSKPGSKGKIYIDVLDRQNDVDKVQFAAPQITGEEIMDFTHWEGDTWALDITNTQDAPAGYHKAWVIAKSADSGSIALYDEISLRIDYWPTNNWVQTWGGVGDDSCNSIAVDGAGNLYVGGDFNETVNFTPGWGNNIFTSNGYADSYLAKFNPDEGLLWLRAWGGTGYDTCYAIELDDNGNIYATGTFSGTVDFDTGPGIVEHTAVGTSGDFYISKFDPDGSFEWVRTWEGYHYYYPVGFKPGNDVAVDGFGNIYVISHYYQKAGVHYMLAVVRKLTPDGGIEFIDEWRGWYHAVGLGIAVDASGNVYCTGYTWPENNYNYQVFLRKLDSNGIMQWEYAWGGWCKKGMTDIGYDVAVDSVGGVYVTGIFVSIVDFDPGPGVNEYTSKGKGDAFLSKFDEYGGYHWTLTWGGYYGYQSYEDVGYALAVDDEDNVYVTGRFAGTADFDPGPEIEYHTVLGAGTYLSKFSNNGDYEWGLSWDSRDGGREVAVDDNGDTYMGGYFRESVDFDPGFATDERTSNGYADAFLVKLNSGGD